MTGNVEIESLVGLHELTAVDRVTVPGQGWGGYDSADFFSFTLSGVTYTTVEDPNDGYRSSMDRLVVSSENLVNKFTPCKVLAMFRPENDYRNGSDILDLVDVTTGKVVLSVGTDHTDDYYPCFTAVWSPENMAANADVKKP